VAKVRDHVNMVRAHYTTYISSYFSLLSFGHAPSLFIKSDSLFFLLFCSICGFFFVLIDSFKKVINKNSKGLKSFQEGANSYK
jgi:hypothetical protein